MNTTVFVTGASKGIGYALANYYLERGDHVVGISRTHTLDHPLYTAMCSDLSTEDALQSFVFPDVPSDHALILINNAGTLGEMNYSGHLDNKGILSAYRLNIAAPAILTNQFIDQFGASHPVLKILQLSSGAGINAYDGWSLYCSSKAALNMLTEVVRKELSIAHRTHIHCLALAPGIIETGMQAQIRASSTDGFSLQPLFVEFKNTGQLRQPADVAPEIAAVIDKMNAYEEGYVDLRR
jgi:benzil reductase ((S)-benzoin forming)